MKRALFALALLLAAAPALAVNPDEILSDPGLEALARTITRQLRCVVCQNQSIDDSEANLARDMRRVVRTRVLAGDGERQVLAFMVARYGDFVLLDPPFKPKTYALWFGPWVVLALAGMIALLWFRVKRSVAAPTSVPQLSAAERTRLDALLAEIDGEPHARGRERKP
ncbi:MAG: cytochrome c-type biogenesis protein CcmH [Alphaproteobacteria bacterium]|nr:cytochrome c-type biogenesis protein CcmH [Alphaproteobacteria bacterium]